MSEKPISPLRQRMIEDMMVRNFVEKTRNDYIRQVKTFTAFLGRSPDQAISEDLRRFQLHQTRAGVRPPSINGSVAGLRFFFTVTLDRPPGGPGSPFRGGTAQDTRRPKPRGGGAVAGGRARTEVQGGTERRLRCGSAGLRGGGAEGVGHRF